MAALAPAASAAIAQLTEQFGFVVDLDRLPTIAGDASHAVASAPSQPARDALHDPVPLLVAPSDPFEAIEKLAQLHARGILGDEEFAAKKAELLKRI